MGPVGVAVACQGRITAAAAPPPPPYSAPPFPEGSSLQPTKPKPRCRIKGRNTYLEEGHWDGSRYGCVGFLVFVCVPGWEYSAAHLRTSLTW